MDFAFAGIIDGEIVGDGAEEIEEIEVSGCWRKLGQVDLTDQDAVGLAGDWQRSRCAGRG